MDGDSHNESKEYDFQRQRYLEDRGYQVLRVDNDEVWKDMESVAEGICLAAGVKWEGV